MSPELNSDSKKRKRATQDNMSKESLRQAKKSKKAISNGISAGKESVSTWNVDVKAEKAASSLHVEEQKSQKKEEKKKQKVKQPNGTDESKAQAINGRPRTKVEEVDSDIPNGTAGEDVFAQTEKLGTSSIGDLNRYGEGTEAHSKAQILRSQSASANEAWKLSKSIGGRFLDQPPIFSSDERFLILANSREIHIYETSSSLLVRRLDVSDIKPVSSFTLSRSNPENLYVGTLAGQISLWHWPSGTKLHGFRLENSITDLSLSDGEESDIEILYTVEEPKRKGDDHIIAAHTLSDRKGASSILIRTTPKPPNMIRVLSGGRILLVSFGNTIAVGQKKNTTERDAATYTWRDMQLPTNVTCFDVIARSLNSTYLGRSKTSSHIEQIDVAIGFDDGKIFLYEDLPSKIAAYGVEAKSTRVEPRVFHWHRRAVGSLAWSIDGLYLISGGQETVLCLWNVGNSRRSDLPHLVSPIQQIVVSPKGASYAISLADNSVIVLSTSELKPTTNIAGLQAQFSLSDARSRSKPFQLDPSNPSHAILAVPASQNGSSCPYIQRFDISAGRHIMRQAMTRSNATSLMDTPSAKLVEEPNVTLIQLSCDGRYMATIDEWTPPVDDLKHVVYANTSIPEERSFRREIHLKFWKVDESNGSWRLITRVEAPHMLEDGHTPGKVYALVSDPQEVGFATLGEDGNVKVWTPKRKAQDGSLVRSTMGDSVFWSSRYTIALERNSLQQHDDTSDVGSEATNASLTYSSDGSIIAASLDLPNGHCNGLVHIISTETGNTSVSLPGLYANDLTAISILQRYLIVLSETLTIWDIVNDELVFTREEGLGDTNFKKYLAINLVDMTFAISFSGVSWEQERFVSKVLIFAVDNLEPLHTREVPNPLISLQATPRSSGYVMLDNKAEIRILSAASATSITVYEDLVAMPETTGDKLEAAEAEDDEDEEMKEENDEAVAEDDQDELEDDDDENDKPVVRPEQLAEIFDVGPSYALPPVKDMFKAITNLYARKPTAQTVS